MKTMQTWQRLSLGLLVLTALALGGGPATAATSAGPYYATPAWDQKLDCPTLATCPRFIVLSNWSSAAVLDRETGLVWEQAPDGTNAYPWSNADVTLTAAWHCNTLSVGNRKGWRLPTLQELASLVDPSESTPALPAGHPFSNVQSALYWSASTLASNASDAWRVNLDDGNVFIVGKSNASFVWCVRGGQGVDPQ